MRWPAAVMVAPAAGLGGVHVVVLLALGAEAGAALGAGPVTIVAAAVLGLAGLGAGAVGAGLARVDAARGCLVASTGAAAASAVIALATGPWGLAAAMPAAGAASGAAWTLSAVLAWELAPQLDRARAVVRHGCGAAALAAVLVAAAAMVVGAGATWRGVYAAVAVAGLLLAAPLVRAPRRPAARRALTPGEAAGRLIRSTTIRRSLHALVAGAAALVATPAVLLAALEGGSALTAAGRMLVLATLPATAALALGAALAVVRRQPTSGQLLRAASALAGVAAAAIAAAATVGLAGAPGAALACAGFTVAAVTAVLVLAAILGAAPAALRREAAGLAVGALAIGAAPVLAAWLVALEELGTQLALVALAAPLPAAIPLLRSAAAAAPADARRAAGAAAPVGDAGRRLTCLGVAVRLGGAQVLSGIDLSANEGEVVAILGVNGAGKTTLLRAIAGLEPLDAGRVLLDGVDVSDWAPERRAHAGFAVMLGQDGTFASLTVDESLALAGGEGPGSGTRAAVAAFPDLDGRGGTRVAALSGGERRQLALAQACARRPRLLLADEPLTGLSPAAATSALAALRDLAAGGTTVVVVEQSLEAVAALTSRCLFLEAGSLRFDGSCDALVASGLLRAVLMA